MMNDTISRILASLVLVSTFTACGSVDSETETPPSETESSFALLTQPKAGIYSSANAVSGFPLGKCGYSGTAAQRDSDMNQYNAPYVMAWTSDSCLVLRERPGGCGLSRDTAECEKWKTQLMKIVFPMSWSGSNSCLTSNQQSKLASTSNMRSIDIGTVTASDASNPTSPTVNVGYFRIFRHNGNYQYEMVAYGSRVPFLGGPLKDVFPGRKSLDGIKLCFGKSYVPGLELPTGRTALSCVRFNDPARASSLFGSLNTTSTAYGFYDPSGHAYCPVDFAPRP